MFDERQDGHYQPPAPAEDFAATLIDYPPHEPSELTEYGNTIVEQEDHKLPEMSELHRTAMLKLAENFRKIGVVDWAGCGSMQKVIAGVQEVSDLPGDIDVVTTVPALEKLWELHQKGELDFGGKAVVHEPKPLGSGEKYGKSKMLQIEINDAIFGSIGIEIFGEGGDPNETINSYGGSVQLGNPKRKAEIWRVEGGIQILSEQDQRRQYALVLCNELTREAGGSKEKIASRMVSLLQYAEEDPELLIADLQVIQDEYGNLPQQLSVMVVNVSTIIRNRESLKELRQDSAEVSEQHALVAPDVERLLQSGAEIIAADTFDAALIRDFLKHATRIDLEQSGRDYKKLRAVYQGIYNMTEHVLEHGTAEEIQVLRDTLAVLYTRNNEPRNLYILFLETKISAVQFQSQKK